MNSAASDPGDGAPAEIPCLSPGPGRALVPVPPVVPAAGFFAGFSRSHGYVAAGIAVVMGLGVVAGTQAFASRPEPVALAQAGPPPETTTEALSRVQGEVRALKASLDGLRNSAEENRQSETIRGLKRSVDALKGDLDGVRTASTAAVGQLGAKLDRLDHDPEARLAQLVARLDRMERIAASADTTGSIPQSGAAAAAQIKPPMPPQRAAVPATPPAVAGASPVLAVPPARPELARLDPAKPESAKPEPAPRPETASRQDAAAKVDSPVRPQEGAAHPATVEGWMLRDVYGGMALLEGRAGGLREVAPGEYIPGVGEIRSIERRGRGWVVVTSRGIIQADNRW